MLEYLLKRVEAATGADRELDADLQDTFDFGELPPATLRLWPFTEGSTRCHSTPRYTASIDAALALVERVMPNYAIYRMSHWPVGREYNANPAFCSLWGVKENGWHSSEDGRWDAEAKTPPLAILAALLRAKTAQEAENA